MSQVDLAVDIGGFLRLRHPFWIASAHYTERESVLDAWVAFDPAALTLKTSHKTPAQEKKKKIRRKTDVCLPRFGRSFYCDGPKHEELLSYDRTAKLLRYALKKLPRARVGISVIADAAQDYGSLKEKCRGAHFCELNLKYSFRFSREAEAEFATVAREKFSKVLQEISRFSDAFSDLPIFIKLSRELTWLPGTSELDELLKLLKTHGKAGLLVANSLKLDIPVFIFSGKEESLRGGVMCGEHLFDSTISFIEGLKNYCEASSVPLVATGGMITMEQILTAMRAGAHAVQLCTIFEYNGLHHYNTLCWDLQNRIELKGLSTFTEFRKRLHIEGVASIYNMPFMYLNQFWADETQKRMLLDISRSTKMGVFVMSGRTLVERWSEDLRRRFRKNLGMRLLLPNPDGGMFHSLQKAWGLTEGPELDARKHRVREAKKKFEELWEQTAKPRKKTPSDNGGDSVFSVLLSNQCPFYSFYLFDDKVYVAPYPFARPGELESPAYVFFAGSKEYERIRSEAEVLVRYAQQTQP